MKTLRYMAAALAAAGLMAAPANATTFTFKGENTGNNVTPEDNFVSCATTNPLQDLCTDDHVEGFTYVKGDLTLDVTTFANVDESLDNLTDANATRLIQDRSPSDSGLGAFGVGESSSDDQTQFEKGEAIKFVFSEIVTVTDVEFNRGGDTDCTPYGGGSEGPCGNFDLYIDGAYKGEYTAINLISVLGRGLEFVLIAIDDPQFDLAGGFTIAELKASVVPVPAALPLLLSGLAGLGFASRRRKSA